VRVAFDDLARHLASKHGKKLPVGSADQVVAEAGKVARRMSQRRDVLLGLLLLVGGLVILGLYGLAILDAYNPTPSRLRPTSDKVIFPIYIAVAGGGAVVVGLQKLIRGLARRSR
jgi:zinc transporter ZupT